MCVCLRSYAADAAAANLTPFCALEFCCTQFAPSFTPWLYCYLLTYYVLTYTGCRYGTGLVVGAGEFTLQRGSDSSLRPDACILDCLHVLLPVWSEYCTLGHGGEDTGTGVCVGARYPVCE